MSLVSNRQRTFRTLLAMTWTIGSAALLVACGGGGSSSTTSSTSSSGTTTTTATAEGAYAGSLSGSPSSTAFELLVLDDGSFWSLYGTESAGILYVSGFVQGSGTSNGTSFTSTNARDFGSVPATAATINASFVPGTSISGTATSGGATLSFSGTTAAIAPYNYSTPAQLSDVAGSWNMTLLDGETAAVSVSSAGAMTGISSQGCQFSGNVVPRASGKNVFDATVTFGASPCSLAGQTATGVAVFSATTTGTKQLIVAVTDATRSYGTVAFGSR